MGLVERPTLGYRTLSDNVWLFNYVESFEENEDGSFTKMRVPGQESDANLWKNNSLGKTWTLWEPSQPAENWFARGLKQGLFIRAYGPEWFNSYNIAAPYGQNDGALWQGKGYNTSLTAGIRAEGYGFELTFKPQVSFSQNLEFELMDNSSFYTNEFAYIWGYGSNKGADAPQRFGNKSFWTYDWGDSEVRWSWNSFTLGLGTESIWLGPAFLNPILHSNNAASYPKFDIGLRKTKITVPYFDWDLGYLETRVWLGKLTESDYFDDDDTNNNNQITGMSIYFSPAILEGLTIGVNKICLSKWNDNEFYKYINPFYGMKGSRDGNEAEDQKVSVSAEWISTKGGMDAFFELAIDDHVNTKDTIDSYITHYWHAFVYTFGLKKRFDIYPKKNILGELLFEWNNTEMSQDFQMHWPYNFGFHHVITQGYTNRGQWLGSGIGYGGQSQYLGFKIYYPKGTSLLYIHRYNPDNNFLFKDAIYSIAGGENDVLHKTTWNFYKGILSIGATSNYFIKDSLDLSAGITYSRIVNPLYNQAETKYKLLHNVMFSLGLKYSI
ncbi:MAG: capsule assembly Wzi family protein [Treponema sp.]|nr:capsule assembly Wzi family protein [Treponema sp.]